MAHTLLLRDNLSHIGGVLHNRQDINDITRFTLVNSHHGYELIALGLDIRHFETLFDFTSFIKSDLVVVLNVGELLRGVGLKLAASKVVYLKAVSR